MFTKDHIATYNNVLSFSYFSGITVLSSIKLPIDRQNYLYPNSALLMPQNKYICHIHLYELKCSILSFTYNCS